MKSKCSKCKAEAIQNIEYAGLKYCEKHFLELIEKRIRKELRTKENIDIKQEQTILKEKSPEYELTKYFLKKIFKERLKLKDTIKKTKNTILPTNLDVEAAKFLNSYFENKTYKEENPKPLRIVTKEEIKLLCQILKIKGAPKKGNEFLDNLEEKYVGSKFSVLRSMDHFEKIKRKK